MDQATAFALTSGAVFENAFLPNLLIFLLGQAAAYGYLRTGRLVRGVSLMVGGFLLADLALLARFVFANAYDIHLAALIAMQAWSLGEVVVFTFGRIRRRLPSTRRQRESLFRTAFLAYLRNDLEPAQRIHRKLLRLDPWDVEAMLALATVLDRRGRRRQARSCYRRARALDREGQFQDVIREELRRFAASARSPDRPGIKGRGTPQKVRQGKLPEAEDVVRTTGGTDVSPGERQNAGGPVR